MQTGSEISVSLTRSVPPRIDEVSRGRGLFWWCGVAAVLAASTILFWFDPALNGFYPRCFFHTLTGWDCPGCGGLRATHQLLHAHWREAFLLNPLFVLALPFIGFFSAQFLIGRITGKDMVQPFRSALWVWIAAFIVISFGVLRNLPWRAWLNSVV